MRDLAAQAQVRVEIDWARSFEAGFSQMTSRRYDAHLVAGRLGERSGVDLLRAYHEAGGEAPVLLLNGGGDRALDLAAMESGAAGFLTKDRLDARRSCSGRPGKSCRNGSRSAPRVSRR